MSISQFLLVLPCKTGRLVFSAWKIIAEEVKHPNCKYLPGVAFSVLNLRIPYYDNLKLSEWYGHDQGRERWRVMHHGISQAFVCLRLFDALDIVGRSGEAARLSGVEFSQSFPGIRGSQYKVEGVLLRSLQSLNSEERGSKEGRRRQSQNLSARDGLTKDGKSQSQSPWKARRNSEFQRIVEDSTSSNFHNLADRCYFFFSPSLRDTNRQEALEKQALTLEPLSGHQLDPVVVCDFTALYPSLVIAYNLCYSTIAGRLEYHSTRNEMRLEGKTTGHIGPLQYEEEMTATVLNHHVKSLYNEDLELLDRAYVTPTGSIYVSETVVKGVLPQVLDEILSTRAMIKKAAKQYKKHVPNLAQSILRQLEARQLALKYVANVTYGKKKFGHVEGVAISLTHRLFCPGYTSATFSGRCAMPLLADTIVECGRRTLTNAINLANQWGQAESHRWAGIKVIYGDTDSLFILLPGRTVQQAFAFGEEFCKTVTDSNPPPIQLKLEKVRIFVVALISRRFTYHCILER
jgi:DNA polymerase elongation subunit (family B)